LFPEYDLASFRLEVEVIMDGPAVVVIDCALTRPAPMTRASTAPILLEEGVFDIFPKNQETSGREIGSEDDKVYKADECSLCFGGKP
jgi:hypothetical protein